MDGANPPTLTEAQRKLLDWAASCALLDICSVCAQHGATAENVPDLAVWIGERFAEREVAMMLLKAGIADVKYTPLPSEPARYTCPKCGRSVFEGAACRRCANIAGAAGN